jgi:hypothetical protein
MLIKFQQFAETISLNKSAILLSSGSNCTGARGFAGRADFVIVRYSAATDISPSNCQFFFRGSQGERHTRKHVQCLCTDKNKRETLLCDPTGPETKNATDTSSKLLLFCLRSLFKEVKCRFQRGLYS